MNKEIAKGIVSDQLEGIAYLEDTNLLFGQHVLNQLALGTYFIDYGDDDFSFDLQDYQEKYISSEYYKAPGHQQWNYYLIFLRETYDERLKQEVEKDGIYTRKFVFTPDELKEYFDYQHSEQVVDTDIISIWKEKLKQVDLDEVYSETPYAQAIPRFLSNDVIKDIENESIVSEVNQELNINRVSSLKLTDNYRKYPLQRNFNLGQVNLITGVNGTGKTSLLESIELIIAGKSSRDPYFNEEYDCIEAKYNNEVRDSYTPGDNTKYRERDKTWYSSAYKSGNELHRAFNKYNFYDSDASYNLSHNSSVGDLTKYLSSIALGSEFNRIQDRLHGFKDRLGKEQRVNLKELEDEKGRIETSKDILDNTGLTSKPEESFKGFILYSKTINWKLELPKTHNESFTSFIDNYQTAQSYINSLNQLLITIKLQNSSAIKGELAKLESTLRFCNKNKIQLNKLSEELTAKRKAFEDTNKQFQTLDSAKRFYNDQSSFKLWKLKDSITELSIKIKEDTRALEHFEKNTDDEIIQKEIIFKLFKKELLNNNQELTDKRKRLNKQIESLKLNLNNLQQVVTEIKSYGKRYLVLNKDADFCPLCETPFEFEELSSRISDIAEAVDENIAIDKLSGQLIQIEGELDSTKYSMHNLQHIESGISILSESGDYLQCSLIEIGKMFESAKSRLLENNRDETKLVQLRNSLEDKGFYEVDFNNLKEELEATAADITFKYENKTKYEVLISKVEIEKSRLLGDIEKIKQIFNELNISATKALKKVAPSINFDDYESELNYRIELLKKGSDYFEKLNEYLIFTENDDITDISQKLDMLFKQYENINNSISGQKELKLANQLKSKAEERVKSLEPKCKKVSDGLVVIDDILENYGEAKVLGDFIKSNEKEIQEIFQNIHSPKEFSQIIFSEDQSTVLMKRRIDGEKMPINKISTGQRSALALSIFLALNKKLKYGPNLILFDDPVTYTDDLNILSFLDYLREMIIHENRQVVFATANQKLAGLFEKKFAFLGNENFKKFHFDR